MNIELTEEQARTLLDVLNKVNHELFPSEIHDCLTEQVSVLEKLIDNCKSEQVNEKQPMYVNKSWLSKKEEEAIKKALLKFVFWSLDPVAFGKTKYDLKILPLMIYFLLDNEVVSEENASFKGLNNLIGGE